MYELVANCPRCGAIKITFDVLSHLHVGSRYDWQHLHETFSVCRHCRHSTVFVLASRSNAQDVLGKKDVVLSHALNDYYEVETYVSLKDAHAIAPPDHVPDNIRAVFKEDATCLKVNCFNAAGTMFRLSVDMATRFLLPAQDINGLNDHIRRTLGPRIEWLLNNQRLPEALRELSTCIREDGNDGAHQGTLQKAEAEDLLDFTVALLERLYTEPERLRLAQQRRNARRQPVAAGQN
jgi:hypothetical protein